MPENYIFRWTFTPANYFEDNLDIIDRNDGISIENGKIQSIIIGNGEVTSRIIINTAGANLHSMCSELLEIVKAAFMAAQALNHEPFTLSDSSVSQLNADGRELGILLLATATLYLSSGRMDIVHKDADGNIIRDTRQDRISKRANVAKLATKHSKDACVNSLLRSYSAAVNDPGNELVHLYEIRDALEKKFGSASKAIKEVPVCKIQWSRLGRLANDEPLRQGRHRGKKLGSLREATASEISEARKIARCMIEGYLRWLSKLDM